MRVGRGAGAVAALQLVLLLLLAVLGPMAFGGVHAPARAALLLIIGGILLSGALLPAGGSPEGGRWILGLGGVVVVSAFLGLVPLPGGVARLLSPVTHQVQQATRALDGALPFTLSIDRHATWREAVALFGAWCLFAAVLRREFPRGAVLAVVGAIFLVAVGEALYGLWQVRGGHAEIYTLAKRYYKNKATGTYVNKNHFAGLLEIGATLGVALLLLPSGGGGAGRALLVLARRLAVAVGILAICLALVASGSRMGLLSLSVGLMGMVVLACFTRRGGVFFLLTLVCLAPLVSVNVLTGFAPLRKVVGELEEDGRRANERLAVWRASIELVSDHPWLGVGAGNWGTAFGQVHPQRLPNRYDEAHNDYLQLWVELGPLALAALLLAAVLWFRGMIGLTRRAQPADRLIAIGIVGAVLSLMVHSLADFNMYVPANRYLIVVLCALGLGLTREGTGRPGAARLSLPLVIAGLLISWQAVAWLDAARFAPYEPQDHSILPDRARFLRRVGRMDPGVRVATLRETIARVGRLLRRDPDNPAWLYERGVLCQQLAAQRGVGADERKRLLDEQRRSFRRAVEGSPMVGSYRLAPAAQLLAQGRLEAADRQVALAARFGRGNSHLSYRCAAYFLDRHAKTGKAEFVERALQALQNSCATGLLEDTRRGTALLWRFLPDVKYLDRILLPDHIPHGLHYLARRGRLKEARALLERDPGWRNKPEKLMQAGKLEWLMGRRARAFEHWRLALVLTDRQRGDWDELAIFLGRYREAWAGFLGHMAARSSPPPELYFRLAVQARKDGRTGLARGYIDRAIGMRPKELRYLRFRADLGR